MWSFRRRRLRPSVETNDGVDPDDENDTIGLAPYDFTSLGNLFGYSSGAW